MLLSACNCVSSIIVVLLLPMDAYTLTSLILCIAVLIAYVNHRFIRMPSSVAIMVGAIIISLLFVGLEQTSLPLFKTHLNQLIQNVNFSHILLKGMLSFLLFAGALTIDVKILKGLKWEIGSLATLTTIASTILVSLFVYMLLPLFHLKLPYLFCLLFGALISPTDPIAVLATFKEVSAPKKLEVCVAGESLFNDGVGIVLFTTFYALTFQHTALQFSAIALLFLKQALGGVGYGLVLGYITLWLLKHSDDDRLSILVTLASVAGGYAAALQLTISGPLAMVVSGIIIGNHQRTTETLNTFWEVIDELLNAMLFLLIGFELLNLISDKLIVLAGFCMIPIILIIRLLTVAIPMKLIQLKRDHNRYTIPLLTWGGLRGGLAIALALSLPASDYRSIILTWTYIVVVFAVIVQGITIKPLAQLAKRAQTT